MKTYTFEFDQTNRMNMVGFVTARSEDEALQMIKDGEYDDIIDKSVVEEGSIEDIKILSIEEADD